MCLGSRTLGLVAAIRVLVADAQRLFGDCLALMIDRAPGIKVVPGTATTGPAALEAAARHRPHVVVLDYWIPGPSNGPSVTRELLQGVSRARVLVLSWVHGPQHAQAALEAGASGFLPKSLHLVQLVEAIRRAHLGEPLVYGEQLAALLDEIERRSEEAEARWERLCSLTPREVAILQLLAEGRPGTEVAAELHMALGSLKTRVHHILRKLGVKSQLEAITMARRERLLQVPGAPGTTGRGQVSPEHDWTP